MNKNFNKIYLCKKISDIDIDSLKSEEEILAKLKQENITIANLVTIEHIKLDIEKDIIELSDEYDKYMNEMDLAFKQFKTEMEKIKKILFILRKYYE